MWLGAMLPRGKALWRVCGLFTDVNILRRMLGLPPVYTALPHASVYGAVHGALAVVLALLARQSSGRGDVIEVPLAAAGASAMGSAVLQITPQPRRYDLPESPRMLSHEYRRRISEAQTGGGARDDLATLDGQIAPLRSGIEWRRCWARCAASRSMG
jgi:hypothetical protein